MSTTEQLFRVIEVLEASRGEYVDAMGSLASDPGACPLFEMHGEIGEVTMAAENSGSESEQGMACVPIGARITSGYKAGSGGFHENCLYLKPSEFDGFVVGHVIGYRLRLYFGHLVIEIDGPDAFRARLLELMNEGQE